MLPPPWELIIRFAQGCLFHGLQEKGIFSRGPEPLFLLEVTQPPAERLCIARTLDSVNFLLEKLLLSDIGGGLGGGWDVCTDLSHRDSGTLWHVGFRADMEQRGGVGAAVLFLHVEPGESQSPADSRICDINGEGKAGEGSQRPGA